MSGHQYGLRMVYERAVASINAASIAAGGPANAANDAVLSQSYLRLEQLASTTANSYQFPVLNNQGTVRPTEMRLNLQDAFFVCQVQFLISATPLATDTNFKLYSYPSAAVFTTAAVQLALQNLYNGYMQLTANNSVISTGWDMNRHFVANQTQYSAANLTIDQFDGGMDGGFPTEPNLVFIGSKNYVLKVILPAAIAALEAGSVTVLAFILRGVLAQNVTVVS
jgi:hypothetical protein